MMRHTQTGTRQVAARHFVLLIAATLMLILMATSWSSVATTECTREHRGDLIIKEGEVFTISDETFCIDGNIIVEENAHLIIRDAIVISNARETQWAADWTDLRVGQGGRLDLFNVVLVADTGCGIWIDTADNAHVRIESVSSHDGPLGIGVCKNSYATITDSTVGDTRLEEGGTLEIRNSTVSGLYMSFDGPSSKVLEGLTPGHFSSWELVLNEALESHLSLLETNVQAWTISVADVANVTLKDSALAYIRVLLGQATGRISNVRPGHYTEWELQGAGKLDCAVNLQLINSDISEGWLIDFTGRTKVSVSNSALERIRVYNTYAELLLQGVDLGGLETEGGIGQISFEEGSISGGVYFSNAMVALEGGVSVLNTAHIDTWQNSTILRTYRVSVEDETGTPAMGTLVALEFPSGKRLSVTTDDNGFASFSISFDDSNYAEDWTLTATLGDQSVVCPISFMSTSPITIHLPGKCEDTTGAN